MEQHNGGGSAQYSSSPSRLSVTPSADLDKNESESRSEPSSLGKSLSCRCVAVSAWLAFIDTGMSLRLNLIKSPARLPLNDTQTTRGGGGSGVDTAAARLGEEDTERVWRKRYQRRF